MDLGQYKTAALAIIRQSSYSENEREQIGCENTLRDMLYTHLKLITEVVIDCLKGDWKADIAATDKNESHMIHLADILTEGIVKQFPEKF
ncbi:hypothetical protein MALU111345_10480 [Marinicrinis lubricantis]